MANTPEKQNVKEDEELLHKAKQRFEASASAEAKNRETALEDIRFSIGEQWDDATKKARAEDNRPCLTINRLPQFIRQITNDQRQNRPSLKVSPVNDKADIDTAKVIQGLIRHVEYASNADTVYSNAFDQAARGGVGYWRVVTEYCSPTSFEQEIKLKKIKNRFSVYFDPNCQEVDGSDAEFASIVIPMPRAEFEAQYPEAKASLMTDWTSLGDTEKGWFDNDSVKVAEYYYKEYKTVTLAQLADGSVKEKSQLAEGEETVSEREAVVPTVKWVKHNGLEILDRRDIPGRFIPIVRVVGDEIDVDGESVFEGVIRHAKDSQRMYNYWATAETETIALAPRAPWVGVEGQFEGHPEWKTANTRNHPYLEYKPKSIGGVPAPAPQRNVFEPPVMAITQARGQAAEDMKATTGIYDAALGNKSNEKSGIAIQRRSAQAQTSNFHLVDNLSKAIRFSGRIMLDWIPEVYDTGRAVRVLHEDDSEEVVKINQVFEEAGKLKIHHMGLGEYDLALDSGPSFATKRQEAIASMSDLSKSFPNLMQFAGDLMVKNMDWPGAPEIAERLQRMLPPQLQTSDKEKGEPLPPQAQAQMAQMQQLIKDLTQHLQEKTHQIETKSIELESKERIAMAQIKAELEINLARLRSGAAETLLEHQIAEISQREQRLHESQPIILDQVSNGAGPMGQPPQDQQLPTGGQTPGQPMGV